MEIGPRLLDWLGNWFINQGVGTIVAHYLSILIAGVGILILAFIANYVAKKILLSILHYYIQKSRNKWDDVLMERKVLHRLSHIAPILVVYASANIFPEAQQTIQRFAMIYMIVVGLFVFNSFLNAVIDIYRTFDISKQRPIKGYIQVIKMIVFIFVGIIVISVIMNQSPGVLLGGFGAMTAIIMLIFKDSILGLVAGVQLSFNDMIRIGDWIEMPKYGADGDVIDISLNTIKVQNWNKTISTIPSYALISDSFKNWRGMDDSGGRRIKRSINIDMNSIRFCTEEMLERFSKIQYISGYIEKKEEELAKFNEDNKTDFSTLVNGRHMTNIGTFRAYVIAYLKHHPKIHQDMTFLIRQLKPTENGLPLEIYVFSNDQIWANYEAIQADIFDHILAVIPEYELRIFQNPTGHDFRKLAEAHK